MECGVCIYATRSAVEIVAMGASQVNSQGGPNQRSHTHRKMKAALEKTSCVVRVVFPINFKGQTPRAKKTDRSGKERQY